MSSELCTHVNARLLPRRWFLQLHWVPGRAHTDAQCINICTKTMALRYTAMVTMVMCRVLMTVANRRLSAPLRFPEAAQRLHSWPGSCLRRASRSEYLSTSSGRSGDRRPAGLLAASQHPGRRGAAASRDPRGLLCGLHAGPHRPQHL